MDSADTHTIDNNLLDTTFLQDSTEQMAALQQCWSNLQQCWSNG
jgi:hypothetical protein